MKTILAAAAIAIGMAAVTIDSAIAQQTQTPAPGQFYGRGPMMGGGWGGGYGPGMMGGYGPGMMGGYGPGMMGGYGPGMMGGGWGMHGGWGSGAGGGPGFGFGGPFAALDLSAEQREKIARIQEDIRTKNWNTMGQIRTEQFKLRQMYFADNVDASAFAEQQRKVDELRRSMLKSRIENRKEIEAVLTAEQRRQFRSFGPWWLQEEGLE